MSDIKSKFCRYQQLQTTASACNKVFRKQYLKLHTIGVIPTWDIAVRITVGDTDVDVLQVTDERTKNNSQTKRARVQTAGTPSPEVAERGPCTNSWSVISTGTCAPRPVTSARWT
jgi:hypothetical protein